MSSAAIFVIGDEILHGEIGDDNGPWLINQLSDLGIDVERCIILPDEPDVIAEELQRFDHCDYRFTTGGLGPTHDDRTLEGVARALDRSLVTDEELIELLQEQHGPLNDAQRRMALRPEGGTFVHIENSLGLGFKVENIYVFPGFPEELKVMFETVADEFGGDVVSASVETATPEGALKDVLDGVRERFDVAVGSYPAHGDEPGRVKVTGTDPDEVDRAIEWTDERVADPE